jgi:hypothetical protein
MRKRSSTELKEIIYSLDPQIHMNFTHLKTFYKKPLRKSIPEQPRAFITLDQKASQLTFASQSEIKTSPNDKTPQQLGSATFLKDDELNHASQAF